MSLRTVHCADALEWLREFQKAQVVSCVASLPDRSEFPESSLAQWKSWFTETAALVMSSASDEGVSVFFQSDIKVDGEWIDKGYLCQRAAESLGMATLFHKVVARAPLGTATFGRPSYSHLLAFSKSLRLRDLSGSTADILADNGERTWVRGMGLKTCLAVGTFLKRETKTQLVLNPFCGEGSMLAAANHLGFDAIGIEKSAKRARRAQTTSLNDDASAWLL
ncbi:MAG TPA: SAM-dependent methyltransferase [Bdellovibrionota bacterium]|nr:SAM-dependent methyltransferase [Bdellovibrionota bacterium]